MFILKIELCFMLFLHINNYCKHTFNHIDSTYDCDLIIFKVDVFSIFYYQTKTICSLFYLELTNMGLIEAGYSFAGYIDLDFFLFFCFRLHINFQVI